MLKMSKTCLPQMRHLNHGGRQTMLDVCRKANVGGRHWVDGPGLKANPQRRIYGEGYVF
jgi:hypothetical protein